MCSEEARQPRSAGPAPLTLRTSARYLYGCLHPDPGREHRRVALLEGFCGRLVIEVRHQLEQTFQRKFCRINYILHHTVSIDRGVGLRHYPRGHGGSPALPAALAKALLKTCMPTVGTTLGRTQDADMSEGSGA